jgi:L-alanine-DL-glutamate epimerase-like enolase superfamily enzyme
VTADRVSADRATVASVTVEAYEIPTDQPEGDGTLTWDSTVMIVVRVTGAGHEGIGWTYAGRAVKTVVDEKLAAVVIGGDVVSVPAQHEHMVRACRNLGRPGLAACAISAVDIALWDLKARCLGVALSDLWGRARVDVPIYGSGGFTTYDDATTAAQLESWVTAGIPRVKIKIGESWGTRPERDLARAALARRVVGDTVGLFVDANGGYTRKQAVRLGRQMTDKYQVSWFEEPVSSDDLTGLREVRDDCDADIAAGEYGYTVEYYAPMIAAGAVDCLQADVTRCGGYTAWAAVSHLAAANGLQISGHCAPNLHAHIAISAPNLRHLEYFHDHTRIEDLLFDGTLPPTGGALIPDRDRPGHGLALRRERAERYRVA